MKKLLLPNYEKLLLLKRTASNIRLGAVLLYKNEDGYQLNGRLKSDTELLKKKCMQYFRVLRSLNMNCEEEEST